MPKYSRRRKGSKKSYNKSKKRLDWAIRIKSIGNWFTPEQKDQLLNAGFNKKEINSLANVSFENIQKATNFYIDNHMENPKRIIIYISKLLQNKIIPDNSFLSLPVTPVSPVSPVSPINKYDNAEFDQQPPENEGNIVLNQFEQQIPENNQNDDLLLEDLFVDPNLNQNVDEMDNEENNVLNIVNNDYDEESDSGDTDSEMSEYDMDGGKKIRKIKKIKTKRGGRKIKRKTQKKMKGGTRFGTGVGSNCSDPNFSIYNTKELTLFPYTPK
jgi:hypothetical protein